jgi:hypothetical protein
MAALAEDSCAAAPVAALAEDSCAAAPVAALAEDSCATAPEAALAEDSCATVLDPEDAALGAPEALPPPLDSAAPLAPPPPAPLPDADSHAPGCAQVPSTCACAVWWIYCRAAQAAAAGPPPLRPRCGKWMLFVPEGPALDSAWARVCALTHGGRLGHAAKVAARLSRTGGPALICVYLTDGCDIAAVMAALVALQDEGLLSGYTNFKMDQQTLDNVYSAGDKRPRGAAGAEPAPGAWPASVPVSRYTSPPSAGPAAELLLHLNHLTEQGTPWVVEDGAARLVPHARCLVARRRAGEAHAQLLPAPFAIVRKK